MQLSFEPSWSSSNYLSTILAAYRDDDGEPEIDSFLNIDLFLNESIEYIPNGFPERNESNVLMKDDSSAGEPMHLLFGGPMEIQTTMEEMCQLCFNGFNEHEYNLNSDPEVAHLKEGTKDWQLLLQLDSDDDLNWTWGDMGMLYFWIRKQDLEKQDFLNVLCEMQCT